MTNSITTKRARRKPVAPRVAVDSIVCASIRCDHPKRRYACSTTVKHKAPDGSTRSYIVPHVDCVYAGVGDRCMACCVGKAAR